MLAFAVAAFSAVFSVVDPPGAVPVFLAMTAHDSPEHKHKTALRASVTMVLALFLFAALGAAILKFFGISIAAFRIAGGVLLFMLAVDMLRAQPSRQRTTPEETAEGLEKEDVSIFPLGIPILSGPGSFATVMLLMSKTPTIWHKAIVFGAVLVTGIIAYATLRMAAAFEKRISRTSMNVFNRVMGLLIAAIAVQFLVDGVHELIPVMLTPSR